MEILEKLRGVLREIKWRVIGRCPVMFGSGGAQCIRVYHNGPHVSKGGIPWADKYTPPRHPDALFSERYGYRLPWPDVRCTVCRGTGDDGDPDYWCCGCGGTGRHGRGSAYKRVLKRRWGTTAA